MKNLSINTNKIKEFTIDSYHFYIKHKNLFVNDKQKTSKCHLKYIIDIVNIKNLILIDTNDGYFIYNKSKDVVTKVYKQEEAIWRPWLQIDALTNGIQIIKSKRFINHKEKLKGSE